MSTCEVKWAAWHTHKCHMAKTEFPKFADGQPVSRSLGASHRDGPNDEIVVLPLGSPPPVVSYDILMLLTTYWDRIIHAVEYCKAFQQHLYNRPQWKRRTSCKWLLKTDRRSEHSPFRVDNPSGRSQSTTHWYKLIWVSPCPLQIIKYDPMMMLLKNYCPKSTTARELVHWKHWGWPSSWSSGSFSLFRSTISSHYLRLGHYCGCRILNRYRLCSKGLKLLAASELFFWQARNH